MKKEEALNLLGFSQESTPTKDEIEKAFKKKAFEHHPDRFPDPAKKLEEEAIFKKIGEAKEFLLNPPSAKGPSFADFFGEQNPFASDDEVGNFFRMHFGNFGHNSPFSQANFVERKTVNVHITLQELCGETEITRTISYRGDDKKEKQIEVKFKPGVDDVRAPKEMKLTNNLFVNVYFNITAQDGVALDDNLHVYTTLPVSYSTLILGGVVEVKLPTTLADVKINIPAGARSGAKLRMKGRGIKFNKKIPASDIIFDLDCVVPKCINENHKKLLEELLVIEQANNTSTKNDGNNDKKNI